MRVPFLDVKRMGEENDINKMDIVSNHEMSFYFKVDGYRSAYSEIMVFLEENVGGWVLTEWNNKVNNTTE